MLSRECLVQSVFSSKGRIKIQVEISNEKKVMIIIVVVVVARKSQIED